MSTPYKSVFTKTEIAKFRNETLGCQFVNHLNNAGASLMPDVVTNAVIDHIKLESQIGGYEAAKMKSLAIEEFYRQAALLINCKARNIAFTASATDSYTRALSSIPFVKGDTILTDCDDFISNQIQFLSLKKRFDLNIVRIKNSPIGGVDLADLEEKLLELKPKLFAITHIPTNSGLVQPITEIAEIYSRYKNTASEPTWYILDACQSAGQMKLDVAKLACDFLSVTNRKFLRGPRGTGFLYISDHALNTGLEPLFIDMRGADWIEKDEYRQQSDGKRFEDWEFAYSLVIGSSEAIRYFRDIGEDKVWNQIKYLSTYLRDKLGSIPSLRLLDRGPEQSSAITFHLECQTPGYIVDKLFQKKINVVSSIRNFAVIDFDEKKVAWAIRASPHYYNTTEELDQLVGSIRSLAAN